VTPLAQKYARQLTLPKAKRKIVDEAGVLSMIRQDMHCFDVTALHGPVLDAMNEETPNALWESTASMVPALFLPSPITWIETYIPEKAVRLAFVLERADDVFTIHMATDGERGLYSFSFCQFQARSILDAKGFGLDVALHTSSENEKKDFESDFTLAPYDLDKIFKERDGDKINLILGAQQAIINKKKILYEEVCDEIEQIKTKVEFSEEVHCHHAITTVVMMLNLINTPGLVGFRQHMPHRALQKDIGRALGVSGSYPLQSWSEVVVKTHTEMAGDSIAESGHTFRKCLHFVRSHRRRLTNKEIIIPAHWRGDPALGIKRTRYTVKPTGLAA
jgi:hypothetical protein